MSKTILYPSLYCEGGVVLRLFGMFHIILGRGGQRIIATAFRFQLDMGVDTVAHAHAAHQSGIETVVAFGDEFIPAVVRCKDKRLFFG